MLINLFDSLSATKTTPKDYEWYQYKGKRTVTVADGHPKYDIDIITDEVFGVRRASKFNYVVDKSDPSIVFKIGDKQLASLYKRSRGWSGKVGRYTVTAGQFGALDKPKSSVDTSVKPPKVKPVTVNTVSNSKRAPNADDPAIRASLKSTKSGLERAVFLFSEEILPGEWRYYYDIDKCLEKYRDAKGKLKPRWEAAVQKILDSKTRLETDVTVTNYKGNLIHLLTVSVDD